MNDTRKEYLNRCLPANWVELDLVGEMADSGCYEESVSSQSAADGYTAKEERLESKRRKDLDTLLKELEEIKQNIERAAEKQHRLANLMNFYSGEFT